MTTARTVVRTGTRVASPYLRAHIDDLMGPLIHVNGQGVWTAKDVLDLGCGNGRNSEWLKGLGFNVTPLDMKDDYGIKCFLGFDSLPVGDKSIDAILLQYVIMFLDMGELCQLAGEVKRVARPGCRIMVEMYPARHSCTRDRKSAIGRADIFRMRLGWKTVDFRGDGMKFIAANQK